MHLHMYLPPHVCVYIHVFCICMYICMPFICLFARLYFYMYIRICTSYIHIQMYVHVCLATKLAHSMPNNYKSVIPVATFWMLTQDIVDSCCCTYILVCSWPTAKTSHRFIHNINIWYNSQTITINSNSYITHTHIHTTYVRTYIHNSYTHK